MGVFHGPFLTIGAAALAAALATVSPAQADPLATMRSPTTDSASWIC
jgi:hypothetical protein